MSVDKAVTGGKLPDPIQMFIQFVEYQHISSFFAAYALNCGEAI